MNPEFLKQRLRDLQVTLRQISGTIPETSGPLRQEMERQYEDVQQEIANIIAESRSGFVAIGPGPNHRRMRLSNRLHR